MTLTDPIADMLTRMRNAIMVRHDNVLIPASKVKLSIAKILKEEGFINDYEIVKGKPHKQIKVHLRYMEDSKPAISGLKRMSKPGLRLYVQKKEIPRVYGGLGIAILSTSQGLRTGQQAWRQGSGGELLCYIW
jgi:small subunit ribosomal protein S8